MHLYPSQTLTEPHYERLKVNAILIQFVSNESLPCEEAMNHMANCRIIKLLWWNLRPIYNALLQPCDILRTMKILKQIFSFRRKFVLASNLVSYGTIPWQAHGKFNIYIVMWVWRFCNLDKLYLFYCVLFFSFFFFPHQKAVAVQFLSPQECVAWLQHLHIIGITC